MRDTRFVKIRLLTKQDGNPVWKAFEGSWLVGMGREDGTLLQGLPARDHKRWGWDHWLVMLAKSGKLVVYQMPVSETESSTIRVYESFDAMQPFVPEDIFQLATKNAGIRQPEQYPEEPLEV